MAKEIKGFNDGHRGRIFSSLILLEETHRKILSAIRDGISSNSGQRLTPLGEEEWRTVDHELREMTVSMRNTVNIFAGQWMKDRLSAEDRKSTLFHLSVLMNELEDQLLLDLSPAKIQANYGRIEDEDAIILQNLHDELAYHINKIKQFILKMRP